MSAKFMAITVIAGLSLGNGVAQESSASEDRYVVSGETERAPSPLTDVLVTTTDRVFYDVEPIAVSDDALMIRHRHGIVTIPADELSDAIRDLYALQPEAPVEPETDLATRSSGVPFGWILPIQLTLNGCVHPVYEAYPILTYRTLRARNARLATVPGRAAAVAQFLRVAGLNQGF